MNDRPEKDGAAAHSSTADRKIDSIRIVGWGHYDFETAKKVRDSGGTFDAQTLLEEVLQEDVDLRTKAERMVIEEIRRKGYWFSGENHQDDVFGMPIFEIDGRPVFLLGLVEALGLPDGRSPYH